MPNNEHGERIAILETLLKESRDEIRELYSLIKEHMEREEKEREELLVLLSKQKGFIAGVSSVVSLIWTVLVVAIEYFRR